MSEIGKGHEVVAVETHAAARPGTQLLQELIGRSVLASNETDDSGHKLDVGDHVHGKDKEGKPVKGVIKSIDEKTHDVVVTDENGVDHHCNAKDLHDDDKK